jgi:hypothetical protein
VARSPSLHGVDMATRRILMSEDKLAALRKGDPARKWVSLDDRCSCILCEKSFSGRQVEVSVSAPGRVRLRCPSDGCAGTPREWVHPGNPLVSQKAWRDWERVLSGAKNPRTKVRKTTTNLGVTA